MTKKNQVSIDTWMHIMAFSHEEHTEVTSHVNYATIKLLKEHSQQETKQFFLQK